MSKEKDYKKIIIIILCIIMSIVCGSAIYVYNLLDKINHMPLVNDTEISTENPSEMTQEDLSVSKDLPIYEETGIINVLLFGLDGKHAEERSRSDVIMIATLDGKQKRIKLTSIMRDTYVSIPGKQDNRINAAYAFGGPALAIRTVNENYDMNIEKYITVDFFSLEKVIDKLGGVEIDIRDYELKELNDIIEGLNNINNNENTSPPILGTGKHILDGRQAVAYSRIRKVGNGDFERTDRQRAVLKSLMKKGVSINIWELPSLLSTVFPEVETNFTKSEILKYGYTAFESAKNGVEELRLPYRDTFQHQRIRRMAVLLSDMEKNREILNKFIYE